VYLRPQLELVSEHTAFETMESIALKIHGKRDVVRISHCEMNTVKWTHASQLSPARLSCAKANQLQHLAHGNSAANLFKVNARHVDSNRDHAIV
jgi:hypothetical protein